MRKVVILALLALSIALPAAALAQPAVPSQPVPSQPRTAAPPAGFVPVARPQESEIEPRRPSRGSGFWTSSRPARNGSYRYPLLIIGAITAASMLTLTIWVVRRTKHTPAC